MTPPNRRAFLMKLPCRFRSLRQRARYRLELVFKPKIPFDARQPLKLGLD
jgi:hypothetical protein